MKRSVRRRWLAVALAALVATGTATTATACDPVSRDWAWTAGKTHGAIIEVTAGRASLGIYRSPRNALHSLYRALGLRAAQDAIWRFGQPPMFTRTFTYRGRTITTSFGTSAVRSATRSLIYDHPDDLRAALVDAQSHRDCLALTLVSYGRPAPNWTHKNVGCQLGSIS